MEQLVISSYCSVRPGAIIVNDEKKIFQNDQNDCNDLLKQLYQQFEIDYPKFYKMDLLSKLAFLSVEAILYRNQFNNKYNSDNIGIILSNSHSSLVTDLQFFDTIKDKNEYFPSPAQFVYTLPNIMIGELAIRHAIEGENCFFVSEHIDVDLLSDYTGILFTMDKIKCCILGWVDITPHGFDSIIYIIEPKQNCNNYFGLLHPEALQILYKQG